MATKDKTKSAIKISNIQEIVGNKRERDNYTFRYDDSGNGYYLVDGKKLSVKEFNSLFPIEAIPIMLHGSNVDSTHVS